MHRSGGEKSCRVVPRRVQRRETLKLNSIFTRPALFKWYSVSGPEGRLAASAYDRSTLMSYFGAGTAKASV